MDVSRPVVRWFGGKWTLAPWIISHFGQHRTYVEPFGGGGSVLLRKPPCYAEVYNDIDGDVVNLFRVLRGPDAADLVRLVELTPFARAEFETSYEPCDSDLERARRMLMRSFMGFGSSGHNIARKTGFRANSNRSGTTPAHDWRNYPASMPGVIERLRGVIIENRDAVAVMRQHDARETLHYVDPPYVWQTRAPARATNKQYGGYVHEMDDAAHDALLDVLQTLTGAVILSGYRCPLYDTALADWHRVDRKAFADGAQSRTESLWLNAAARAAMPERQLIEGNA